MTGTRQRANLGYLIDNIWTELDQDLWDEHPYNSEKPHVALLELGQRVIDYCRSRGAKLNPRMDDLDHEIWLRVVGAWVCYLEREKEPRCSVANKINIDASNLTNFINGKRPITANALTTLAALFGIQSFDLRPDLGADFVANLKKENERKLDNIGKEISKAQGQLDSMHRRQKNSLEVLESSLDDVSCQSDQPEKSKTLKRALNDIRSNAALASELSSRLKNLKREVCT